MYLPVVQTVYLPANIVFYYFKLISVSFSKTALSVVPGEGRQMFCKNKKKTKERLFFIQTAAPKFVAHSAQQDFSIENPEKQAETCHG